MWDTIVRLLEGLDRRPVLDAREAANAEVLPAGGTPEDRFAQLLLAPMLLERLGRYGARVALDGASAAYVLGFGVAPMTLQVASPATDAVLLLRAMNDGAAAGWSERLRDYRVRLQDADQLVVAATTHWLMRVFEFALRVREAWTPLDLTLGGRSVAVLALDDLEPGWASERAR